jgi:hypothetical protein
MARLTVRSIGFVAIASLGAAGLYGYFLHRAPGCASDAAMRQVSMRLHDQFHFDGVMVNNATGISGSYFDARRECSAQVAQIRGDVAASDMHWRAIHYWIASGEQPERLDVRLELGEAVPLAAPPLTLWQRLLGLFGIAPTNRD